MKSREKIKAIALCAMLLVLQTGIKAQPISKESQKNNYKTAIGLRFGETSGLTVKHFFEANKAVEGVVTFWPYTIGVTALYEKYISTGLKGFNCYFGAGGHVNNGYTVYHIFYNDNTYTLYHCDFPGLGVGINGAAGVEYKIPGARIAISLDLMPFAEITNYPVIFLALNAGLGIKYAF